MANLKTDSPVSRRIASSFLRFLHSVEPSPGVGSEALDVARECLAEVFKIDSSSLYNQSNCDSLIDIFSSREAIAHGEIDNAVVSDAPSTSSGKSTEVLEALQSSGQDTTREQHSHGKGKDELFGQFFGALEKIHYFKRMPDGNDDHVQLDRATHVFHNVVEEMQIAGCQTFDQKSLAETFKSQALQLDPTNDSVKENIRVAEQKLKEEQQRPDQVSTSTTHGESSHQSERGSRSHSAPPPPFPYMQFNIDGLPTNITSMLRNMAANANPGQNFENRPEGDSDTGAHNEPEIRIGGNINLNVNELPEELSGAFRSMMGMFSRPSPQGNQQDDIGGI